jgi:flagellar basal body P-ring protein FlgI
MRRIDSRRVQVIASLAAIGALAVALGGAGTPPKKKKPGIPPRVEETVGDLADIFHRSELVLDGVGLVVGLDNTGGDAPPSTDRQRLIDMMRKESVENPNRMLKEDHTVSMVHVRLVVPVGAAPTDRLDLEISLPAGSATKSLAGGYLLATRLREIQVHNGNEHDSLDRAFAQGPVMIGTPTRPNDLRVGRVLGGGRIKQEIPFQIALKESRRSFRASKMIEDTVNQRFPQTRGVDQKGSAVAKTDQVIELKVPRVYHENQTRFFQIVKLLPMVDTPALRAQRTTEWGRQLLDPATAKKSALRLEALGVTAVDALKEGLTSTDPSVRFCAAESLAYLNEPSCVEILGEAAIKSPENRPFALAALSAMDQAVSHLKLRKLMDEPDVEVRYGAFNALRVAAADDPFLGLVRVLDDPEEPEPEIGVDQMAVAIAAANRRRARVEDPFKLYLVDCEGPPMIHVARTRRCEVVVFGRGAKLLTPVVLGTGSYLLNASDGDETVEVSKIAPRAAGGESKVASSLELGDILRRTANLGATYPELVTILQSAERQRNLPGPLVIDAVPGTTPVIAKNEAKKSVGKKDDAVKRAKAEESGKRRGLFDRIFGRESK